nr:major myo-inositol transporter IolT [Raoultella sp. NCTC 9187]
MVLVGMLLFLSFQQGALVAGDLAAAVGDLPHPPARDLYGRGGVLNVDRQLHDFALLPDPAVVDWPLRNLLYLAGIGVFGALFVIKCVPETRNRSLEQIEHYLQDRLDTSEERKAARKVWAESQADKA